MIEQAEVPLVVDAGLGSPSHAAEAMEMGADAVLVNTAIARAGDPVAMARAFRLAVEAGRAALRAGVMEERRGASRRARSGVTRSELRSVVNGRGRRLEAGDTVARAARAARPRRRATRSSSATASRSSAPATPRSGSRTATPRRRAARCRRLTLLDGAALPDHGRAPGPRRLPRGGRARRRRPRPAAREVARGRRAARCSRRLARSRGGSASRSSSTTAPTSPSSSAPTTSTSARTTCRSAAARRFGLPVGLSTHSPAEIDARRGRLHRRRARLRHADEGGSPARRARARPLRRRARAGCRGSRSAGSTRATSRTWSAPGRRGSPSCARSATPTIPSRPPGSCGRRCPSLASGSAGRPRRAGPGRARDALRFWVKSPVQAMTLRPGLNWLRLAVEKTPGCAHLR